MSANDLPIAHFCMGIENEWKELVGAAGSEGNDWKPPPLKVE